MMASKNFRRRTRFEVPATELFRWHARPGAFERLTPPWAPVEVLERSGDGITDGSRVTLGVWLGPLRLRWVSEHGAYQEGRQFRDVQVAGPFAHWEHTHRFEPHGEAAAYLEDHISYALPVAAVSHWLAGPFVHRQLERLFAYRHRITGDDLAAHRQWKGGKAMHVLVSGSTGLVGSALVPFLTTGGHQVTRLVRSAPRSGAKEVPWDPARGRVPTPGLEGVDAVVHLAGENIASGRWTAEKKARIRDSRVQGTRLLCEALAELAEPPKVLVSASAIGYYGDCGDRVLREDSPPGDDFLAEVCRGWEDATQPARQRGIRVVNLRFGIVLSPAGGALSKMLTPFKLGLGGVIGSGEQYMSWIALDDVVGAIHHALVTETLQGPVNAVAPQPVTNREFTRTLGRVLGRPTLFPMPAFAARTIFGEMADALLLASTRVDATRLRETDYAFRFADLESALRHLLGKTRAA
jgi:uncharacterized protein (TIGR01777 family)